MKRYLPFLTILLFNWSSIALAENTGSSALNPEVTTAPRAVEHIEPVVPGSEVMSGEQKLRVITTSGKIETSPPPEIPQAPQLPASPQVTIGALIVDTR